MTIIETAALFICVVASSLALFYWITVPFSMVSLALDQASEIQKNIDKYRNFCAPYQGFSEAQGLMDERIALINRYYLRSIISVIVFFCCVTYFIYKTLSILYCLASIMPCICFFACLNYNKKNKVWRDDRQHFLVKCVNYTQKIGDAEEYYSLNGEEKAIRHDELINLMRNVADTLDPFLHISLAALGATVAFAICSVGLLGKVWE